MNEGKYKNCLLAVKTHILHILYSQKHMTLKYITCKSFPWNKAGDFRTPILCPSMDKNKIEKARAGRCASCVTFKLGNF